MPGYASNYYRQTASNPVSFAPLSGDRQVDVCIVGAGLAGLTAALTLARQGRKVAVLEAEKVAWGASGRNGGVVSPGYATSFDKIAARAGLENAKELHRLSIEGVRVVRNNIAKLKLSAAQPINGTLKVSRYEHAADALERVRWLKDTFGYEVQFIPGNEISRLLSSKKHFHATHDPQAFHFHPLNYATGLASEIARLGGEIFEGSRALAIEKTNGHRSIRTAQGSVEARDVLIACGGYTDGLVPRIQSSYIPITTYMIVTREGRDQIEQAIRTRYAIGDSRRASDYYRLVDDGSRILWGGMITTQQTEPKTLGRMLQKRMVDTYPSLAGLEVEQSWSGKMAYARHLMPQIGRLEEGLWYCTSFGGHGMNTTAVGGTVIAEGILGESDRYKLFAPFGLTWNGAAIGRLAVQTSYWYLQMRDLLQEARSGI